MKTAEKNKIKRNLIKAITENGDYTPLTDDDLIKRYITNLEILEDLTLDIATRGKVVQMGKDGNFMQVNFSIGAFQNTVKSNLAILKALGLSKDVKEDGKDKALAAFNKLLE